MIIKRNKPSVQSINIGNSRYVRFIPGNNIIAEADEKAILNSVTHKKLVENGVHSIIDKSRSIKKISNTTQEPNKDVVNEILKMSTKKAKVIIDGIMDKNILEKLLDADKRSGIQDSVFSQLKKLELPEDLERKKDGTDN